MEKTRTIQCPHCENEFEPTSHLAWQLAAAGGGLVLGSLLTESFLGGVVMGGICFMAARYYGRHVKLTCPRCGQNAAKGIGTTPSGTPTEEQKAA